MFENKRIYEQTMNIFKKDVCVVIQTCEKYYDTRLQIQYDTFLKFLDKQQVFIFSDVNFKINQFDILSCDRSKFNIKNKYVVDPKPFYNSLLYLKNYDFDYVIYMCDDVFLDINYTIERMNELKFYEFEYIYAGMPLKKLSNQFKFKIGFASGGNVRILNRNAIKLLIDIYPKYIDILPIKYKKDFEFNKCDDVITGYIFQYSNIDLINIFHQPIVMTLIQTYPNIHQAYNYIKNNKQIGYHFLYHCDNLSLQYQNDYFKILSKKLKEDRYEK